MQTPTNGGMIDRVTTVTFKPGDLFHLYRSSYVTCFCVFVAETDGWVDWYEVDNWGRARMHGDFARNVDILYRGRYITVL